MVINDICVCVCVSKIRKCTKCFLGSIHALDNKGKQAAYGKSNVKQNVLTSRCYVCPLIFNNSWKSLIPNHLPYAVGRQRELNLISNNGQSKESQKSRKQPDMLHFHNWLIQRIPPSFNETVFRLLRRPPSFHSKVKI